MLLATASLQHGSSVGVNKGDGQSAGAEVLRSPGLAGSSGAFELPSAVAAGGGISFSYLAKQTRTAVISVQLLESSSLFLLAYLYTHHF